MIYFKLKYIVVLIIILVFTTTSSFSQIKKVDLLGSWIKVHTNMKDGSSLIPIYPDYIKFIEFTFYRNTFSTNYYPVTKFKEESNSYQINDSTIFISNNLSYQIEKLTKDSLVIVEKMNWLEDDKLRRFYLKRKEVLSEEESNKFQNTSQIKANPYYTPIYNGNLNFTLNKSLNRKHRNQKLQGILQIFPTKRKIEVNITYRSTEDYKQENIIKSVLENSFKKWDLSGFEHYSSISIEFAIIVEKTKTFRGLTIELLSDSFTQLLGLYGLSYEQLFDGNKYFKKGIESYQSENYTLAIKHFSKSYELNHTKVDALYNRAACYIQLNQLDKACDDWKTLSELGQKTGEKLYLQNCN